MTQTPTLERLAARTNTAAKSLANVRDALTRAGITDSDLHAAAHDATLRASHIAAVLAYRSTQTRAGTPA